MAPSDLLVRNRKQERKQKRESRKKGKSVSLSTVQVKVEEEKEEKAHDSARRRSTTTHHEKSDERLGDRTKNKKRPATTTNSNNNSKKVSTSLSSGNHQNKKRKSNHRNNNKANDALYARLDPEAAAAIQREDAEIAELEAKLGLADRKEKKRLHKEYATQEGYGEDFGEFLNDLDNMVERLTGDRDDDDDDDDDNDDEKSSDSSSLEEEDEEVKMDGAKSSDDDEEEDVEEEKSDSDNIAASSDCDATSDSDAEESVPMKAPADDNERKEEADSSDASDDDSVESDGDEEKDEEEPDHNVKDTYRPAQGEDIYGNVIDQTKQSTKLSKYVPPHLRGKGNANKNDTDSGDSAEDEASEESLKTIRRTLNNALNRLSEDTLQTVAQSIARLYPSHPTPIVNRCIWENTHNACIARSYLMTGLTPLYTAALVGVHIQKGDSAQLGEFIIEMAVTDLYKKLSVEREKQPNELPDLDEGEVASSSTAKEATNLILLLCYLYNLDVVHCGLMYDIIRDLIQSFKEIDIELLLIILSHSGRSLRSDDPSALKAIVLDVQARVLSRKNALHNSSRVDYMVSAVMDLKNNKRRNQDSAFGDKTVKLRKQLGHIKSNVAASNGNVRTSDSSHRITLKDILEVEERGRWWRVGASWEGNQHAFRGGGEKNSSESTQKPRGVNADEQDAEKESELLLLAAKYRMNTDTRRTIFCIIMGSADYEDAFEKLVKAGMLKNKAERETARVLMECCGNEKSFNHFYAHLSKRICEYQSQSKFTFQLAYWDIFKQMDESMKPRKAANLAKLLFALVVQHRVLKLHVLRGIDMTSPEDLSEIGMIFLTVFFSTIMDHFDDPSDVAMFFESGLKNRQSESPDDIGNGDQADETEAFYASLTLFFVQVLKSSPKHVKGSKFRANLKAAIKSCDADQFFA